MSTFLGLSISNKLEKASEREGVAVVEAFCERLKVPNRFRDIGVLTRPQGARTGELRPLAASPGPPLRLKGTSRNMAATTLNATLGLGMPSFTVLPLFSRCTTQ